MHSSIPSIHLPALEALGWCPFFQSQLDALAEPLLPARVALATRGRLHLLAARGELDAVIAGRLAHATADESELPAVGDWVALRPQADGGLSAVLHVLPRRTCFARRAPGRRLERQVVAANVDRVFVVTSVGADLNPRRLERYLAAAADGGAAPAVVLSKADLADDPTGEERTARAVAGDAPVFVVSALRGDGIDALRGTLRPGETIALLGSSGVGKSALVNRLLGEEAQLVGPIREHDGRGQHTTTHRELVAMPGGALLVDTPGMRELALWGGDDAPGAFGDVEALAAACRFGDCTHQTEPGCRVLEAIEAGELEPERLASYEKLGRELARLHRTQDARARHDERRKRVRFARSIRARPPKG